MLVNQFLQDSAERSPAKTALVCDGRRLTYGQVEEQANRAANGLLALGVQRGDRVAVWLPNSVETAIAIFAILKAGAVFTVINSTTKPDKLAYVLNNCEAVALFAPRRGAEQAAVVAGRSGRADVAPRGRGLRRRPRTEHGPRAAAADG